MPSEEAGGVLRHPLTPFCARVGTPASLWWQRGATEHRASLPAAFQACPLPRTLPRDSDLSLPRTVVGGRELLSLSDEGLQLVFVQVNPTLPLELLPHIRPTPPHGLQSSKNLQRFREGHRLG